MSRRSETVALYRLNLLFDRVFEYLPKHKQTKSTIQQPAPFFPLSLFARQRQVYQFVHVSLARLADAIDAIERLFFGRLVHARFRSTVD
jgi:hypothetical protein